MQFQGVTASGAKASYIRVLSQTPQLFTPLEPSPPGWAAGRFGCVVTNASAWPHQLSSLGNFHPVVVPEFVQPVSDGSVPAEVELSTGWSDLGLLRPIHILFHES